MIVGVSGKGKSVLFKDAVPVAQPELIETLNGMPLMTLSGRPLFELGDPLTFTLNSNFEPIKLDIRLNAVKEAYWNNIDKSESDVISDMISYILELQEVSLETVRVVFMLLPATIVGKGISFGFDDTEVRDNIYEYVEKHKEGILKELKSITTTELD